MYTVSVPIMNYSVTEETADTYIRLLKQAKAERVFLVVFGYGADSEADKKTADSLKINIARFRKAGIKADVWVGQTLGHGSALALSADFESDLSRYTTMVDLAGRHYPSVCCPMDEAFRKRMGEYISAIATSGAELILLDDDFRMAHSGEPCCACALHMAHIEKTCGEKIERETLKKRAFSGKSNAYREAWLSAQKEGLTLLAADIRRAVDLVAPSVRVGLCAAHSLWGADGTDAVSLARVLAGKDTKPFLRLHGAPYWSIVAQRPMPTVIEMARMYAASYDGHEEEMIAEGDVYPRPRYNVPSSILEMFDAAMRIDGRYNGILKYMVDYNASPAFETGYLSRHTKNLPVFDELARLFAGKREVGVDVSVPFGIARDVDYGISLHGNYPKSLAGFMMALNGISATYGNGICRAVFGEAARSVPLDEIKKGAILDALAAEILRERGVDVGLACSPVFKPAQASFLKNTEGECACLFRADFRRAELSLQANAHVTSYVTAADLAADAGSNGSCGIIVGKDVPFSYTYENADGMKLAVFCFDAMGLPENMTLLRGYLQQEIVKNAVEWIAGEKLPAFLSGAPDLYTMCKQDENGMAVALFNFFADSVENPVIELSCAYKNVRFLNCEGTLEGDKVILSSPIGAYTFAAFEVFDRI